MSNDAITKLRLLVWNDCNRSCEMCCNNDWSIDELPVEEDFAQYEEIFLTGGEPLLYPAKLAAIIAQIRITSTAKIYVYTAKADDLRAIEYILQLVDGMTFTLHEQSDLPDFVRFAEKADYCTQYKSLRLNVFAGVSIHGSLPGWQIKDEIEWIPNCPLPQGEALKRYGGSA